MVQTDPWTRFHELAGFLRVAQGYLSSIWLPEQSLLVWPGAKNHWLQLWAEKLLLLLCRKKSLTLMLWPSCYAWLLAERKLVILLAMLSYFLYLVLTYGYLSHRSSLKNFAEFSRLSWPLYQRKVPRVHNQLPRTSSLFRLNLYLKEMNSHMMSDQLLVLWYITKLSVSHLIKPHDKLSQNLLCLRSSMLTLYRFPSPLP